MATTDNMGGPATVSYAGPSLVPQQHTYGHVYVCSAAAIFTTDHLLFNSGRLGNAFGLQIMLSLRDFHHEQPFQHVRQLHTLPSGHHCPNTEAGHCPVVQGVQ